MFWILLFSVLLAWISYLVILQKRPKNFPRGPRGWPLVGNLFQLGLEPHRTMCQLGKKYGRVFTLNFGSFPVVILNHPETIRKVLSMDGFEGRPSQLPLIKLGDQGVAFASGDIWREQRRFILHKLKDYGYGKTVMEGVVADDMQVFVEYLKNLKGESIYPASMLSMVALNSLWAIVAGKKYALNDPGAKKLQHYGHEAFMATGASALAYFMPWLVRNFPSLSGYSHNEKYALKYYEGLWNMGLENATTFDPDVERHFMDSYWKKMQETTDPGSSFFKGNNAEMSFKHTFASLFNAGNDTLSATMTWAILYLGLHPEKCDRLYKEISNVVGENGTPTKDHLPRMHYTQATMQEVNRFASVVPNAILHSTTKNVQFEGFSLPKDTIVLANLFAAHYDQGVWGDPENFRPERFMDEGGNFVKSEAVMAFGVGKRACLAEPMAMTQFFIYLTVLVQNFKFEFDMEKCGSLPKLHETQGAGLTLHPKLYFVKFVSRM